MISRIRDQKNYKTPNAQICFELKNSGNRSMFCLSMSSLIAAQTNIYQKKKIYLFYVVMGSRNTLSYCKIYAIVEYSQQKFKMLRRSIVQQLKNFILKNCLTLNLSQVCCLKDPLRLFILLITSARSAPGLPNFN